MKGLKRPANSRRGKVLGHRLGGELLGYTEARKRVYIPLYEQALARLGPELEALRELAVEHGSRLVLLDYETNTDVEDTRKPLSHASLVMLRLQRTPRD